MAVVKSLWSSSHDMLRLSTWPCPMAPRGVGKSWRWLEAKQLFRWEESIIVHQQAHIEPSVLMMTKVICSVGKLICSKTILFIFLSTCIAIPNVTAAGKSYIQECSTNTTVLALEMKINREINSQSVYLQIFLNMDGYTLPLITKGTKYKSKTLKVFIYSFLKYFFITKILYKSKWRGSAFILLYIAQAIFCICRNKQ